MRVCRTVVSRTPAHAAGRYWRLYPYNTQPRCARGCIFAARVPETGHLENASANPNPRAPSSASSCRLPASKTPEPPIDPFFRSATGLEPFHHAGTALEHGYSTRIDIWSRLRNADKAWRTNSSYCPTEPTPLAPQRELWQLPLG